MISESLISSSAFSAGCRHQRKEFEIKLNAQISRLKYAEQASARLCQDEKLREYRAAREAFEEFTLDLGCKLF